MEDTKIAWCHFTFNPWTGCQKVHTGCTACYAERLSLRNQGVFGQWGANGTRVRTGESYWRKPLKWDQKARSTGKWRVFCASLADIFEDRPELVLWRQDLFDLIDRTQNLSWLVLTKRPENIARLWPNNGHRHNVWLGTSVSDQETADVWIPRLRVARHLVPILFVSAEPLVGPINHLDLGGIDWMITGGESGPRARPMRAEWVRDIQRQCKAVGASFFMKQLGSVWAREIGSRDLKGEEVSEFPVGLRIREFPLSRCEKCGGFGNMVSGVYQCKDCPHCWSTR